MKGRPAGLAESYMRGEVKKKLHANTRRERHVWRREGRVGFLVDELYMRALTISSPWYISNHMFIASNKIVLMVLNDVQGHARGR